MNNFFLFLFDTFKPDTPFISDVTNVFRKTYNAISSTIISAKSLVFYPAQALYDYFSTGESVFNKFKNWFTSNNSVNNSENINVQLNENSQIVIARLDTQCKTFREHIATHLANNDHEAANLINTKLNEYMEISNRIKDGRIKIDTLDDLKFHLANPPRPGEPSIIKNNDTNSTNTSSENSEIEINDNRTVNQPRASTSNINQPKPTTSNNVDLDQIERLSNASKEAFSKPSSPVIPDAPPAPKAPPVIPQAPTQDTNRNALLESIQKGKTLRKVTTKINEVSDLGGAVKNAFGLNKVDPSLISDKSAPNTANARTIIPDTRNEPLPGTSTDNSLINSLSNKFDRLRDANDSPEIDETLVLQNQIDISIKKIRGYNDSLKNLYNEPSSFKESVFFVFFF